MRRAVYHAVRRRDTGMVRLNLRKETKLFSPPKPVGYNLAELKDKTLSLL